jgi:hypothetical protein
VGIQYYAKESTEHRMQKITCPGTQKYFLYNFAPFPRCFSMHLKFQEIQKQPVENGLAEAEMLF